MVCRVPLQMSDVAAARKGCTDGGGGGPLKTHGLFVFCESDATIGHWALGPAPALE